jgi:hypothetical protein
VALSKIEGVEKVLVSGTNAIVILNSDQDDLKKASIRKAFGSAGLKLEKVTKGEFDKPQVGYRFVGKGGG